MSNPQEEICKIEGKKVLRNRKACHCESQSSLAVESVSKMHNLRFHANAVKKITDSTSFAPQNDRTSLSTR